MILSPPMQEWLKYLQTQLRYSSHTLAAYQKDLEHLLDCLKNQPLETVLESDIRRCIAQLHASGLSARSLARALAAWRGFYQWWAPQAGLKQNPTTGLRAPKKKQDLPKALSVEQMQTLLEHPDLPQADTAVQWRDQAMFELLYSSGLRLAELVSLDTHYHSSKNYTSRSWINLTEQEATIQGKGNKTRLVPIGSKARQALERWLEKRPELVKTPSDGSNTAALFLGMRGARISPRIVQRQLTRLAQAAGLPLQVHPHSLRHSFASHLLQSAQDLRAVQELLGHANIATTQIYTRLDFQHLAQVYDQAHPRAQRKNK